MSNWVTVSLSVLMVCLLASCANLDQRLAKKPIENKVTEEQKILVVNSNVEVERYRVVEDAFVALFEEEGIDRLDLANDIEPLELLLDQINSNDYGAIYCIGARSLGLVDYIDPEVPVVFNSVLNWRRFQHTSEYYGVASEVSLLAQLTWFKYFFPELSKLGVLYSQTNAELVKEAVQHANKLGIELIATEVETSGYLHDKASETLSSVDALWLISDPVVMSSSTELESLFGYAKSKDIPVFAYDSVFVDMGAVLGIVADLATSGRQAALMMKSLQKKEFSGDAITFPAGSHLILNTNALKSSKLKLNENALDSISEIRE